MATRQEPERGGAGEVDRGREAERPTQVPARGWRDVLLRVKADVKEDQVALVAAGVAFYAMLALFPTLIAAISIYGLFVDAEQAARHVQTLTQIMPKQAASLIGTQLTEVARASSGAKVTSLVISIVTALWSASAGMKALITGVNIAYDERETRGFLKLRGLALLLTVGGILVFGLAIGAIAVFPALASHLPGGHVLELAANVLRWVVLAVVIIGALAVIYRLSPDRDQPRMRWVSSGAIMAAVFWLIASIGFSFYADNFSNYNKTYGSLGAVIILMFWLYISAFIILLGAELNGQLELQTRRDTTTGPSQPLGQRDAVAADRVAESPATGRRRARRR